MVANSTIKLLIPAAVLFILVKCDNTISLKANGDFKVKEEIRSEIVKMMTEYNDNLVISAENEDQSDRDLKNETFMFVNRILNDDFDVEVIFKDMSNYEDMQESAPPEIVVGKRALCE